MSGILSIIVALLLEIKRTSITRLKHTNNGSGKWVQSLEIKRTSITRLKPDSGTRKLASSSTLEIKRTSITRLKQEFQERWVRHRKAWNQKNIDYEIETLNIRSARTVKWFTWNQKNLDYEIETVKIIKHNTPTVSLKSKEPRLRDWNKRSGHHRRFWHRSLKSKEPRLRDWNSPCCRV